MSEERWDLPSNWTWASAGEIADIIGGGTPTASNERNFSIPGKGHPWITPADLTGYQDTSISHGKRDISDQGISVSAVKLIPKNSVLFSSRAPIGYAVVNNIPVYTNQGFKSLALLDKGLCPWFIRHYLKSAKDYAESLASGSTFKELSGSRMAELAIPLAPEAEQRRIVAKLDVLQSRTRLAREALAAIPTLLDHYRQSVLAAAFTGKLSNTEISATNIILSGSQPFIDGDLDIPVHWKMTRIGDVCVKVQDGNYGGDYPKEDEWVSNGVPFLTGAALGDSGDILRHKLRYITKTKHQQLQKAQIQAGDVVFPNRGARDSQLNGSAQMSYLIGPELGDANINPQLTLLRPHPLILSAYLKHYLDSIVFLSQHKMATGGSALAFINLEKTRLIAVPLPPVEEQHLIIANIERLMGKIGFLYSIFSKTSQGMRYLEQSLLSTAFRGELVPQDPADEPASVLLDRIRAARAQAGDNPRPRRKPSPGMEGKEGLKPSASAAPSPASHPAQTTSAPAPSPTTSATADPYATILAALRQHGSLASADAQAATGLDATAVRPLLQRLVIEGQARVEGQKRGTRYVATRPT